MEGIASRNCTVAIIGGGIGGLVTAIGLGRAGYDVHIFEQAEKFAEIGAGVAIGGNSYKALKLFPDLGEGYAKVADVSPPGTVWFDFVDWRDHKRVIGSPVSKPEYTNVHRAHFLEELLRNLPDAVHINFGCRIDHVENFSSSRIGTLAFKAEGSAAEDNRAYSDASRIRADNTDVSSRPESRYQNTDASSSRTEGVRLLVTEANKNTSPDYPPAPRLFECDICIGADGVKSAVRKSLDLGGIVRYTGTYAYRGLLPTNQAVELVGECITKPKMWCGKDKHILTFPIDGGKVINLVAFVTDRSKPEDQRFHQGPWVTPSSHDEMAKDYAGWDPMVVEMFDLIERPERWALHDLLPLDAYLKGRAVLLGDAAHASLPHNGAGAGQAIEDAYILSAIFSHPACNAETAPAFLEVYQAIRLPRANKQMVHSRRSGDLYEFASNLGDDYTAMGAEMRTRWNWIWDHDHESDVAHAMEMIRSKGY